MGYSFRLAARVILYASSQTGLHIPRPLLHQSWNAGWNEKLLNGSTMKDRSDDLSHHEWWLLPWSYISLLLRVATPLAIVVGISHGPVKNYQGVAYLDKVVPDDRFFALVKPGDREPFKVLHLWNLDILLEEIHPLVLVIVSSVNPCIPTPSQEVGLAMVHFIEVGHPTFSDDAL